MKICKGCEKELEDTEEFFFKLKGGSGKLYLTNKCKECLRAIRRSQYKENPEPVRERKREWDRNNKERVKEHKKTYYTGEMRESIKEKAKLWQRSNPERVRITFIRHAYGLEPSDIIDLMDSQRGCCAICKETLIDSNGSRNYHIDHNHEDSEVRGLLCRFCNNSLGLVKEDVEILKSMINYIIKHRRLCECSIT